MNATTNTLSQLLISGAGQLPAMPQATGRKQEQSAFDRLVREKHRENAPGEKAPQTDTGNKTLAETDGHQPADGAEEIVTDEQYALAAALSVPTAGIFMPIQMIVHAGEQPQDTRLPVTAAHTQPIGAEIQLTDAVQVMDLPIEKTALQQTQQQQFSAQPIASDDVQQETMTVTPKADNAADTTLRSDVDTHDQPEVMVLETAHRPVFDAVQSVPIKVGEAEAAPVDTEAPNLETQLAERLERALGQGESRLAVRLTPENLGTMQVQLTRSSDGSLSVVLSASTEKAAALLERHSAGLQSLLMANAQAPVKIEVQHSGEGQQAQQHSLDQDGGNRHGQQHTRDPHQREQAADTQNFMQQLRLGLVDLSDAVS